ncbi:hypothetical protein C9J03_20545 [Photobacterium gaetbulicola]|uniref:Uncharacterized protein n=1 Tax=Photobacterium gaetbulicola TaxID=1295392 RepID=A0A0B9FW14_9GAMM|nr:hypothetical protein [Photobacterium gaetbulicola]KHT60698.1 hypothetical protein RJ45_23175 [Photobacterium gaetbulicola]PSU03715.1 hypothetical protein C9J03_20545 [Photobacterium gaetbulicola]
MRPASFVRYSTPRSPSRLRSTSHAPTLKSKKNHAAVQPLPVTPASHKADVILGSSEQAA